MRETYVRLASAVSGALATLYVIALFFDWQHVSVGVGAVQINVDSGWGGWGIVGGIMAVGIVAYSLLEVSGYIPPEPGTEVAPVAMAIILLLATAARYATIDNVDVAGVVQVERLWPATVGLVLALGIAGAELTRVVLQGPAFRAQPLSLNR